MLITSRLLPSELNGLAYAATVEINGFSEAEIIRFYHSQGIRGNASEILSACEAYGFHPLATRLLARLILRDKETPCDVCVADRYRLAPESVREDGRRHILKVAYDALCTESREVLTRLAAFRAPVPYEALFKLIDRDRSVLDECLEDLITRGLVQWDRQRNRYDLHPIVRQYAYDRLTDKLVHTRLRDYFSAIPVIHLTSVTTLEDIAPIIELFHHSIRATAYAEAYALFLDRLSDILLNRLGACRLAIDMLEDLVLEPAGGIEYRLRNTRSLSWALNLLAACYGHTGHPYRAEKLLTAGLKVHNWKKEAQSSYHAAELLNLATAQKDLGKLGQARNTINSVPTAASTCVLEDLELQICCGAVAEVELSIERFEHALSDPAVRDPELQDNVSAFMAQIAIFALKEHRSSRARKAALAALETCQDQPRHRIRANWVMGWTSLEHGGNPEPYLTKALLECRRLQLVEVEPDIMLTWASYYSSQGKTAEAIQMAEEALAIAERSKYRLKKADLTLFLAQTSLAMGQRQTAKIQAATAKQAALCDGRAYRYHYAYLTAEQLMRELARVK